MIAEHSDVPSKRSALIGWIMSGLVIAFMILDGFMKMNPAQVVIDASKQLGLPSTAEFARTLGALGLASTLLYAIPRTAVLGAILLTAYMGGTVEAHLRIGDPLFTHTLFGVYLAILAWGGLFARNTQLCRLLGFGAGPLQ